MGRVDPFGRLETVRERKLAETLERDLGSDAAARAAYEQFARPRVAELLSAVDLDVVYHRAEGDYLWYRDRASVERRVLDLVGGFGASLFGHNAPPLVAALQRALADSVPFNAQASVRSSAARLGQRLSQRVGRVTGQSYVVTLASTGAEAVEAALKHAEMEAGVRRNAVLDGLRRVASRARNAPTRSPELRGEAIDELLSRATTELSRTPVVLALTGAFHGKTTGALRLTHNTAFREPWRRFGQATFLPPDDIPALEETVRANTSTVEVLRADAVGRFQRVRQPITHVLAAFCEPIQGEGGIREISADYLRAVRRLADEHGFPLVFDEIQCGMGRTGRFLASEWSGVRGDYYLLSKSLGGGLSKVSALMVERKRYGADFGYLHTSTFAEDELSSAVALAALDLLENDGGALLEACQAKGAHLLSRLRRLSLDFPEQVEAVRGRGLMVGLVLKSQADSPSRLLRVLSEQRLFGFFIASYLLREHSIRVSPALSDHGTIRLEPSAGITIAELDRAVSALRTTLGLVQSGDVGALLGLETRVTPASSSRACAPTSAVTSERPGPIPKVAFLAHLRHASDLRLLDHQLAELDVHRCKELLGRVSRVLEPFLLGTEVLKSSHGNSVELNVITVPFTAAEALGALRAGDGDRVQRQVQAAIELSARLGCSLVGCGGYTSIVSDNCQSLVTEGLGITSGNSLTAVATAEALLGTARRRSIEPRVLGVVGAAGNIGAMLGELASEGAERVVLIGRAGAAPRLRRVADRLGCPVTLATSLDALRECSLIVTATNSPVPIVLPEHIGTHPLVLCDAAVPNDVSADVLVERPNAVVIRGGSLRLPLSQELCSPGLSVSKGTVYACLAETVVLGLSGMYQSFSYGALRLDQVKLIRTLAHHHGFSVVENLGLEAESWRGRDG